MGTVLLATALLLVAAAPAAAAPRLVSIGTFSQPVFVASPPGDTHLYVVEKAGTIKLVGGGTFLDISSQVLSSNEERGLLSMAFSPNYATNGLFYVFYTADDPPGEIRVVEYRRSADPNRADPNSARPLYTTPHAQTFHNGGQLQIGPDGMLYVSIGDNGQSADAQDTSVPYGKILRLNPATGAAAAGNPHGVVWSWGLRNPWRFTFDRGTGDLIIGDVGDGTREEVDWARAPQAGRAVNYGWPCKEGTENHAGSCSGTITGPAFDYGRSGDCNAVVGGYVVRDRGLPTLTGRLLYGDLCHEGLRSIALPNSGDRAEPLNVPALSSFGEDGCGHIFATSLNGPVYRIQDGAVSPCSSSSADTAPPGLAVGLAGVRKLLKKRALRVGVRCSEACSVTVGTRFRKVRRLKARHRTLAVQQRKVVRIKLGKALTRKLRKRVRRRGFVRIAVTVRATDAAGNVAKKTKRGRVKRRR
jgi:glucose/arabinose dehydrogenase